MYDKFDRLRSSNKKTVEEINKLRGSLGLHREDIYSERKKNGINHPALQMGVSVKPKNSYAVGLTKKSRNDKKQIDNLISRVNKADDSSIYKK